MSNQTPTNDQLIADLITICLHQRLGWPWNLRSRLDDLETILEELGRRQQPDSLTWMVYGLGFPKTRVVATAAVAATRLFPTWQTKHWVRLDQQLRSRWIDTQRSASRILSRREGSEIVGRLPSSGPARIAGLALLASHNSGFIRQQAVEALANIPTTEALSTLTVRLADWVDVVRDQATKAWCGLLTADQLEIVVETLPLIWRVMTHQRVDTELAWEALSALLSTRDGHDALLNGIAGSRVDIARGALTAILKCDLAPERWLPVALRSSETSIRFQAARTLIAQDQPKVIGRHLETLAQDRFASIKHLALDASTTYFPERLESIARQGLLDRSASFRCRCQEILVLKRDVDPSPIYRSHLDADLKASQRASALLGLAETGGEPDRSIFEAHLEDQSTRVRAAAINGLSRLALATDADRFFQFLRDPSPRVVRGTVAALHNVSWKPQQLFDTFKSPSSSPHRRSLIKLASQIAIWDRLPFLIDFLRDPDPSVHNAAAHVLRTALFSPQGWAHGKPSPTQRRTLEAKLRFRDGSLSNGFDQQLRFLLRLTK